MWINPVSPWPQVLVGGFFFCWCLESINAGIQQGNTQILLLLSGCVGFGHPEKTSVPVSFCAALPHSESFHEENLPNCSNLLEQHRSLPSGFLLLTLKGFLVDSSGCLICISSFERTEACFRFHFILEYMEILPHRLLISTTYK